jgi:hypothetical protein
MESLLLEDAKMRTNPVLVVIALAAVSLLALNFSSAATTMTTATPALLLDQSQLQWGSDAERLCLGLSLCIIL